MLPLWLGLALATVATVAADPRWTQRERDDPLEQLTLEPGVLAPSAPVAPPLPAPPATDASHTDAGAEMPPRAESLPPGEGVEVARIRQITVGQPARAERLASMLRSGADLESAKRALGGLDVTERSRDYVVADLEPDIRVEIEGMRDGDWSRVRTTRGRAILYQLVSRDRRDPASLPAFGTGLGPEETARLQRLQRPRPVPRPVAVDETRDEERAAVVQAAQVEYPRDVTGAGKVVVKVMLGRADDVVDVQIESSTDPKFNDAALRAARMSTYRTARRDGIPETSTISVTFEFAEPPSQQPQQGQP